MRSAALILAADPCYSLLNRKIRDYLGLDSYLSVWNDYPGRRQEDVIELFKEAAERADREGKTYG